MQIDYVLLGALLLLIIISLVNTMILLSLVRPEHEEEMGGYIKPTRLSDRKLKAYSPSNDIVKIMEGESEPDQFN